jgi:formylglycine-generating enzyme required for sulfatase activity
MKTTTLQKLAAACLTALLAFSAWAVEPSVSDVAVRQRWPWSRLVDIDYVLTCDPTQRVDIALTAHDGSAELPLPPESLTGDLYGVSPGACRIVWDPVKTAYTNKILTQFSVTLAPTLAPLYMIMDLTKEAGAEGQIEYVYPGDERLETYGRFTNVWFGVTNDIYKTDKLVLRRISAGSFLTGSAHPPTIPVTLTKDYYVGVFEVTQRQWYNVKGSYFVPYFTDPDALPYRPVDRASYDTIRGTAAQGGAGWPTNTDVYADSFVGKLRAKAGGQLAFDLPTEAQWEYACRAGTASLFNDGDVSANVTGANAYTNEWLDALGRYKFNGGWPDGKTEPSPTDSCGATNGTAIVGAYLPNAWGIYDMHGNLWERCLDLYAALAPNPPPDPVGPLSNADGTRVIRGSGYRYQASACTVRERRSCTQTDNYYAYGFRIAIRLP